jgi:hypothetical protein
MVAGVRERVPILGVLEVVVWVDEFLDDAPAKVSAQYRAVASNPARSDK